MKLNALNDYVIVQMNEVKQDKVIITAQADTFSYSQGKVVSCGANSVLSEGVEVILPRQGWYRLDGDTFPPLVAIRESELIATVSSETK